MIKKDLESYPIDYLRNKVTDPRYKDPLTKKLAKYNSEVYDEIFALEIADDFEIKDGVIKNRRADIGFILKGMPEGMMKPNASPKTYHCILL